MTASSRWQCGQRAASLDLAEPIKRICERRRKHHLVERYLHGRVPSIVTFGAEGGYEAVLAFFDALQLVKRLLNLGTPRPWPSIRPPPPTASCPTTSW